MGPAEHADFSTTRWSLVLAAANNQSAEARQALAALCERYWFPLYAYVRRNGYNVADAQDLTQEFFTRLLDKDWLLDVNPQRGKFRAFLLAAVRHFLANARDYERAQKRGGGRTLLSLDFTEAEQRYLAEPADPWTAEKLFERRWAIELLAAVLARLQAEFADRSDFFAQVKGFLDGTEDRTHGQVAAALGMSEGALKTAVHRLRRRYRQHLRDEIALTVADPSDIDAEMQQLLQAFQKES